VADPGTKPVRVTGTTADSRTWSTWPDGRAVVVESAKTHKSAWRRWLLRLTLLAALFLVSIPLLLFVAIYKQSRTNEAHAADAIVVLGAAQFNGVPSQVFQARLDTAYDLYVQGYAPLIVVTGGRLYGDQYTEAESGRTYLIDRGVPADAILMENVSHNTAASFDGVEKLLKPRGVESLLVVSDGFHLYRSKMLANAAGFEAYCFASEDSPIRPGSGTELRYLVRETLGVLAWKLHIKR
jgi:vancomycin permeability regulator SanA